MSDSNDSSGESSVPVDELLGMLEDWYHLPVIGGVLAFMFWVRVQSWKAFQTGGEVHFSGNDAYYHFRQITYTVQNWPETMPYDVWTAFPTGTSSGQFGTLYDQILATVALGVGLGNPSENMIGMVLVISPAVFGALLAIPVYFMGKRLGGRFGGVFAAVILALLPGYFLIRTRAGAGDHNAAEPLFQAVAVLAMMVALTVAEREKPVFEQFLNRDAAGLRHVVGWSALAGIATAAYMWMWPPGVLLVGIFGAFFLVKLVSDYVSGTSPDHVAIVGAVSMATTGLLLFVPMGETGFSVSNYSFVQPFFSLAVAVGCVFLAWFAREWDRREFTEASYAVSVFALLFVGIAAVTVALPSLWGTVQNNLLRFVGFSSGAATRTIGEAQPFLARQTQYGLGTFGVVFLEYGLAFFTAMVGAAWILLRPHVVSGNLRRIAGASVAIVVVGVLYAASGIPAWLGGLFGIGGQLTALVLVGATLTIVAVTGDHDAEKLLVVVWGAFITSAAFTQVRFNYYLVVPVVVLNAYLLGSLLAALDLDRPASKIEDVSWYQVGTVTMVVLLVLVPVAAPAVAETIDNDSQPGSSSPITLTNNQNQQVPLQSAIAVGASNGPGEVVEWDNALEWMKDNTPSEGEYGGADNADELEYYGTYAQTDDFDYPEGSYGVMSWWDYGHWITTEAERIPHANPFQQNADNAANFLLANNESRAEDVMNAIDEDDASMRYVAVDWQMALPNQKFGAPIQFYDGPRNLSGGDFYRQAINSQYDGSQITDYGALQSAQLVKRQAYYESMLVRLYRYHGSAQDAQPVVFDWRDSLQTTTGAEVLSFDSSTQNVLNFDNMSAAQAYVENDTRSQLTGEPTSQIGGTSGLPEEDVPALQHYRLIGVSDEHLAPFNYLQQLGPQRPMAVKLFERVQGAEVTGTGPANTTVTASVTLNMSQMTSSQDGSHPQFTYRQHAETGPDGEFTMTLPYSSTGYENFGPDNGHTNVSVRAAGPYEFSTGNMTAEDTVTTIEYNDTADVTEAQVLGESDDTVTVDLERHVVEEPGGANNSTSSLAGPDSWTLADDAGAVDDDTGASSGDSATSGSEPVLTGGVTATAAAIPALAGLTAIRRGH